GKHAAAVENTAPEANQSPGAAAVAKKTWDASILAASASPTTSSPPAAVFSDERDTEHVDDARDASPDAEHNPAAQEGTGREGINVTSVEASNAGEAADLNTESAKAREERGEATNAADADPTATPGADAVAHVGEHTQNGDICAAPAQATQDPQEGAAGLDAQPGVAGADADAVHAHPDLAAAPPAGRSGSRARRRGKPKKKPKEAAIAPLHQWEEEEDEATEQEIDPELEKHQTYHDKAAACRKNYIYCLISHLNNKEKKLENQDEEIKHHCKTKHQCKNGGIQCEMKGCLVRAKYRGDIGLHQSVCHKL
ncbi:unnamed protein product, partial [Urochloa humidicola]